MQKNVAIDATLFRLQCTMAAQALQTTQKNQKVLEGKCINILYFFVLKYYLPLQPCSNTKTDDVKEEKAIKPAQYDTQNL